MALFVDSSDYPAIRALIDLGITESDITDEMIAGDVFLGAAEQEVLDRDPDAETRTGTDAERIKRAVMYLTAANLTPSAVRLTSLQMTVRDASFSRATFDPAEKVAELRAKAQAEIAAVITPSEEIPDMPIMFTTVPGYRGR